LKKILLFIVITFFQAAKSYSQVISGVYVYEPSNSKFTTYDIDPQGRIYFGGYLRTTNMTQDTIGNITFQGYWYEDGMTFRADSTGFIDWITITGNGNGLEDTRAIRYWNGSVYSAGIFIASGGQILVNSVSVPFAFGCCYNGYLMKQSEDGVFDWLFSLQYNAYDMQMDNSGNCYVTEQGAMKKINSLGTEIWSAGITPLGSQLLIHNDTIYLYGIFQDSLSIGGNTFVAYGPQNDVDMFIARYHASTGNFIDAVHIGSPTWDVMHDIIEDANGDVWISGITGDGSLIGADPLCGTGPRLFFTKLNNDLSPGYCDNLKQADNYNQTISGEMIFNAGNERIAVLNLGDTVFIGQDTLTFPDPGGYEGGCLIVKWDAAGNLLWYKALATPTNGSRDVARVSAHLRKSLNGKYFLAGQMREPCVIEGVSYDSSHYYEAFFASLADTTFITGIPQLQESNLEVIFENPVKDHLVISSSEIATSITIFNVMGEMVYQTHPGGLSTPIDVSELPAGGYFFRFVAGDKIIQKKFIKV